MLHLINYFKDNKKAILDFMKYEIYIFPKLFMEKTRHLNEEEFYENLKIKNNIFDYFFSFNEIKIFNITRFSIQEYFFKSDIEYEVLYLFFSSENEIYLNNKKIKSDYLVCKSNEDIFIKNADFLKICFFEKENFSFEDFHIIHKEKNIFDETKIKKISKNNIFKKLKILFFMLQKSFK